MKKNGLKVQLFNRTKNEQRWKLELSRDSGDSATSGEEIVLAAQQSCTATLQTDNHVRLKVSCSGFDDTNVDLRRDTLDVSCLGDSSGRLTTILPSERKGPDQEGGMCKIQVGCGPHNIFPDWWNVDVRPFPGVDAVFDATQTWPYSNLRFIYGEHFLEHLNLDQAIKFFISAGKSLAPGGVLRLTTPNLEWVMRTHYRFASDPRATLIDTLRTNRAFHGWGHQFLYSKSMVTALCSSIGFEKVEFFDYGESPHEELRNLERHGKWRRDESGLENHLVFEVTPGPKIAVPSELMPLLEKEFLNAFRGGH
jgi:predicted SAM-dependent methyltransferase